MLGYLFKYFNYLRYSAGIAILLDGYPIIFFIRDTLKIGPSGAIFSAAFLGMGLALMFPFHLFVRLYKVNFTLLKYAILFLALMLYHFFLFNTSGSDYVIELGNNVYILVFLFLLFHVPNEVKDTLIPIIFLISFVGNLTLIYSLITDPAWRIGMRAAVTFSSDGGETSSNPHIAARNGIICLMTSVIMARQYGNILLKLFLYSTALVSAAIIIFAQVKSSILGLGVVVAFFLYYNFTFTAIVRSIQGLFTVRNLILLVLMFIALNMFLSRFGDVYGYLDGYISVLIDKGYDLLYTASGIQLGTKGATLDDSAMGRVSSFGYFREALLYDPTVLILGRGYKDFYMDIPILESLVNHGIFGFILFGGFNLYAFIFSVREIKNPTNMLTIFLAYFYMYLTILLMTTGRPYDTYFWFPFAIMIRFLGVKYLDSEPPEAKPPALARRADLQPTR